MRMYIYACGLAGLMNWFGACGLRPLSVGGVGGVSSWRDRSRGHRYAVAIRFGLITKSDCWTMFASALVRLYFKPIMTGPASRLIRSDRSPSITGRPRNL